MYFWDFAGRLHTHNNKLCFLTFPVTLVNGIHAGEYLEPSAGTKHENMSPSSDRGVRMLSAAQCFVPRTVGVRPLVQVHQQEKGILDSSSHQEVL